MGKRGVALIGVAGIITAIVLLLSRKAEAAPVLIPGQGLVITVSPEGAGTVAISPAHPQPGDIIGIKANANTGWRFVAWVGSIYSTNSVIWVMAGKDYGLTALFERIA